MYAVWRSLCLEEKVNHDNSSFYRSGRAMPGLTGSIIGRAGGRIMWGPGIICICPPIGGRIPGPAERKRSLLQTWLLFFNFFIYTCKRCIFKTTMH